MDYVDRNQVYLNFKDTLATATSQSCVNKHALV